jgi:uncharacterized membrane protein
MAVHFVRLIQLIAYLVITSQLLFYMFILSDSLKKVSLNNFLELRKVIDVSFGHRFRVIYYSGLILSLIAVLLYVNEPGSILFITTAIGFICLVADVAIAMKCNVPLNTLFNNYQPADVTHNWQTLRLQWIRFINIRGVFIVIGMVTQMAGLLR